MTDNPLYVTRSADDFWQMNQLKRYLKGHRGFIAGGAFKNVLQNEPFKDIDVFFESAEDWGHAVKKYTKKGYTVAYENPRVKAFIDPVTHVRIELVGCPQEEIDKSAAFDSEPPVNFANIEDTIDYFDFTITKFALFRTREELAPAPLNLFDSASATPEPEYGPWEYHIMHHKNFFEHLQQKRLVIDPDELVKPFSTFERALRYTRYGYNLCRESKVTLISQIQDRDFAGEAQLSSSLYNGVD